MVSVRVKCVDEPAVCAGGLCQRKHANGFCCKESEGTRKGAPVMCCHRLPSLAIACHRLPSVAIGLPSLAIGCHRLPSVAIASSHGAHVPIIARELGVFSCLNSRVHDACSGV